MDRSQRNILSHQCPKLDAGPGPSNLPLISSEHGGCEYAICDNNWYVRRTNWLLRP
jgi:hypothetical protein